MPCKPCMRVDRSHSHSLEPKLSKRDQHTCIPLPCAVLLRRFVEQAEAEERGTLDPAAAPAGSLLPAVEQLINMGASLLGHGVQDVLAGPSHPGLQQQLSPRVQRALQASTLKPQQLVAWLESMVAASRVLFHLKGEQCGALV